MCLKMHPKSDKTDLDSLNIRIDSNIMYSGLTQDFKADQWCKKFYNEAVKI